MPTFVDVQYVFFSYLVDAHTVPTEAFNIVQVTVPDGASAGARVSFDIPYGTCVVPQPDTFICMQPL